MPESSLNDLYRDIAGDVGDYLGWGRGAWNNDIAWDDDQEKTVLRFVKGGLRTFYFPPPVNGVQYQWSFLKPIATLTLAEGNDELALPDDFGGFESSVTIVADGSAVRVPWPIRLTLEANLREGYSGLPTTSGRPIAAALVAEKGVSLQHSNRTHLRFFPLPDADYVVQFQYYLLPDMLTGAKPYAYGGAPHAETILESCLAKAELAGDDMQNGPHKIAFMERLAASILHDRKYKAQFIGVNRDNSDDTQEGRRYVRPAYWNAGGITYNGQPM